ncbi:tripartite tricarboxylate transporter TctB family protein [Marinomonas sp. 15G1-11]|uniref:Tripartite tricarboxylate transporter TctB family protein n=1 Tax=Marinomonas phaeophyticola TaxID=3004091 RepID=A0ABT4JWQ3_9GAMM|nr:tripartite tricarboxylate transporter TctB family protein [Marinomonas sp. 15G1-11]MCZ2722651.1 tripartite tricarboxylate transporter TctB family protein [Marinomonas sp. 15G1-11]
MNNDSASLPPDSPRRELSGSKRDAWIGLVMILFSGLMLLWGIPAQISDRGSFGVPPSFAPRVLSGLILILGSYLVLSNFWALIPQRSRQQPALQQTPNQISDKTGKAQELTLANLAHLALCIGSGVGMLLLMKVIGDISGQANWGFLIAAPLGLIAFTAIHRGAPLKAYLFNSVVMPLVIFSVFWLGLSLPLP